MTQTAYDMIFGAFNEREERYLCKEVSYLWINSKKKVLFCSVEVGTPFSIRLWLLWKAGPGFVIVCRFLKIAVGPVYREHIYMYWAESEIDPDYLPRGRIFCRKKRKNNVTGWFLKIKPDYLSRQDPYKCLTVSVSWACLVWHSIHIMTYRTQKTEK